MFRLGLVVVVLAACMGCGYAPGSQALYTVTSIVMQKPGQAPVACFGVPLPEPPIGCGGVALSGILLSGMPGYVVYRNGVMATGMVRLVGAWGGRQLTVTEPPTSAAASDATRPSQCSQDGSEAQGPDLTREVVDDESVLKAHGIQPLQFGMCKQSLFIVVPVADPSTVSFLTARYGSVQVAGWLQPVR